MSCTLALLVVNSDTKTSVEWEGQLSGPDFLENEFSLWGYSNAIVYDTYPANIPDFKQQVYQHIEAIPNDLLRCVMDSVLGQMQECRGGDGGHLKNVILMYWWLHFIVHWVKNVHICISFYYSSHVTSKQSAVSYPPLRNHSASLSVLFRDKLITFLILKALLLFQLMHTIIKS